MLDRMLNTSIVMIMQVQSTISDLIIWVPATTCTFLCVALRRNLQPDLDFQVHQACAKLSLTGVALRSRREHTEIIRK